MKTPLYHVGNISFGFDKLGYGFEITQGDTLLAEFLKSDDGFILKPTEEFDKVDNQKALTKVVEQSQKMLDALSERFSR